MPDQLIFLISKLPQLLLGFPGQRPGGLVLSVLLAFTAIVLGFGIALLLGTGVGSPFKPFRWGSQAYVQIIRGLPLILLVLLIHQLLENGRRMGLNFSPSVSALVALTLYSSAYQAEIVRAGLQAFPQRLGDSARLLGGNPRQVYLLVKFNYVWRVMLPALTGQAISLFKDTSVVVIIGVADLMTVARITLGSNVGNAPYWVGLYLLVGLLYFCVAFVLSQLARRLERRYRMSDLVQSFEIS